MARSVRDAKLDSRNARLRLPKQRRFFLRIGSGLSLVYRRDNEGHGLWSAKFLRNSGAAYQLLVIGQADDFLDADGTTILDFFQAQERCRELKRQQLKTNGIVHLEATVSELANSYLEWFQANRRSYKSTRLTVMSHIIPHLGSFIASKLTAQKMREWHQAIASSQPRLRSGLYCQQKYREIEFASDAGRARKATANRILTILKAILNRAYLEGKLPDDSQWRRVKPFGNVNDARVRFLTPAETFRLLKACSSDLKDLIQAALYTGCRFGELSNLTVQDIHLDLKRIYISDSKSGKPRYIPLNTNAYTFFARMTEGKNSESRVLLRSTGLPWEKNHYTRQLLKISASVGFEKPVTFHEFRHTFASMLAQQGVDLLTISKLLGHADTRITSKHYAHLCDRTLEKAVGLLPAFETKEILRAV